MPNATPPGCAPGRHAPAVTSRTWRSSASASGFDQARDRAMAEASRRLAQRAADVRQQLADDAQRLLSDLDKWRQAELAEAERRFAHGSGQAVQLSIFADMGHGILHTMDEARKLVEEEFDRRRDGSAAGLRSCRNGSA